MKRITSTEHLRRIASAQTDSSRLHPFSSDPFSPAAIENKHKEIDGHFIALEEQLDELTAKCATLGRSYALSAATRNIHAGLISLQTMFSNNAEYLREHRNPIDLRVTPLFFHRLANSCEDLRERIDEFKGTPEGNNIKARMDSFSKDMSYRASSLRELVPADTGYEKPIELLDVDSISRYIHGLYGEMDEDLKDLTTVFRQFHTHGIPSMQYEEQREADVLLSVSTVGTLLSAVTATTLQISLGLSSDDFPLIPIVNSFWFCSLVLSIGAALNSLLSIIWKRTPYGARGRRLPLSVTVLINFSGTFFLAISILAFSAGLALFAFASHQPIHTKCVALAATALTMLGLSFTILWFLHEHLQMSAQPAEKISDTALSGKNSRRPRSWAGTGTVASVASSMGKSVVSWVIDPTSVPDIEAQDGTDSKLARTAAVYNLVRKAFRPGTQRRAGNVSFGAGVHEAIPVSYPSPFDMAVPDRPRGYLSLNGLIQDIEYSSDASLMATISHDQKSNTSTVTIYNTTLEYAQNEYKHRGEKIKQVAWSPTSEHLLVRLHRGYQIFDRNCKLLKRAQRRHSVQCVVWSNPTQSSKDSKTQATDFLLVEKNGIIEMNMEGREIARHAFNTLLLRDVAVVPRSHYILITGRVMQSSQDRMPINSRAEKRLILYDLHTRQTIRRIPFLDDIRYVRIARSVVVRGGGLDILLSLKDKPSSLLWTLKVQAPSPILEPYEISHQEKQATAPTLAGHAYFIGEKDQMIACRGSNGDVHLWDRSSGKPLKPINVNVAVQGVRSFAWRPTSSSITFASVRDTTLEIWSTETITIVPSRRPATESVLKPVQPQITIIPPEPAPPWYQRWRTGSADSSSPQIPSPVIPAPVPAPEPARSWYARLRTHKPETKVTIDPPIIPPIIPPPLVPLAPRPPRPPRRSSESSSGPYNFVVPAPRYATPRYATPSRPSSTEPRRPPPEPRMERRQTNIAQPPSPPMPYRHAPSRPSSTEPRRPPPEPRREPHQINVIHPPSPPVPYRYEPSRPSSPEPSRLPPEPRMERRQPNIAQPPSPSMPSRYEPSHRATPIRPSVERRPPIISVPAHEYPAQDYPAPRPEPPMPKISVTTSRSEPHHYTMPMHAPDPPTPRFDVHPPPGSQPKPSVIVEPRSVPAARRNREH